MGALVGSEIPNLRTRLRMLLRAEAFRICAFKGKLIASLSLFSPQAAVACLARSNNHFIRLPAAELVRGLRFFIANGAVVFQLSLGQGPTGCTSEGQHLHIHN